MKRKSTRLFVAATLVFCLILSFGLGVFGSDLLGITDKDMDYLKSVMGMIKERYKGDVDRKKLMEGTLRGMFNTMDPYTVFLTPEEAKSFFNNVGGTYEGIGISMEKKGDYVVVMKVFNLSPAEKAGIIQGDVLVKVDGKDVTGASTEELAGLIMGKAGTRVVLGVLRNGSNDILSFEVTRGKIKINPVDLCSQFIKHLDHLLFFPFLSLTMIEAGQEDHCGRVSVAFPERILKKFNGLVVFVLLNQIPGLLAHSNHFFFNFPC